MPTEEPMWEVTVKTERVYKITVLAPSSGDAGVRAGDLIKKGTTEPFSEVIHDFDIKQVEG